MIIQTLKQFAARPCWRNSVLQAVLCASALLLVWRVSMFAILASKSDLSRDTVQEIVNASRAYTIVPRGGVDIFELNGNCINFEDDRFQPLLSSTFQKNMSVSAIWDLSGHAVQKISSDSHQATFNPFQWLFIHMAATAIVIACLALKSGALKLGVPLHLTDFSCGFGPAWLRCALSAGLLALIPWFLVGPAEFFWWSIWSRWGGAAWIVTHPLAFWGPFIGACILYAITTVRVADKSLARTADAWSVRAGHHEHQCPTCGYPAQSAICSECGADSHQPVENVYLLQGYSFKKRQSTRKVVYALAIVGVLAYALPMLWGAGKALVLMATS